MKKMLLLWVFCMTLMSLCPVYGGEQVLSVYYEGQRIPFEVDPVVVKGRAMVPLKNLFHALDVYYQWDSEHRTIIFTSANETMVTLTIGQTLVSDVGEDDFYLETPPVIIGNNAFVPLRLVTEKLGKNIRYDGQTNTVYIEKRIKDNMYLDSSNHLKFEQSRCAFS